MKMPSSRADLAKIYIPKKGLCLTDDVYRDVLQNNGRYGLFARPKQRLSSRQQVDL